MSITAYSRYYNRELDVAQLLALARGATNLAPINSAADIPPSWREWIRQDIECPSCGVTGAQIVATSRSKKSDTPIRQPHFRFDSAGTDAHRPFCEFSTTTALRLQGDMVVDFLRPRSKDTQIVRDLVCKGVAHGMFSQVDIRGMRQWFFETKVSNRFTVAATVSDIQWLFALRSPYPGELSFHPCHAEIPGFDWKAAGNARLMMTYAASLRGQREYYFPDARNKALTLLSKHEGQEMFDVTAIEAEYKKTLALCSFIGKNFAPLCISEKKRALQDFPVMLLAFCAVILYKSKWDLDFAVALLVNIIHSPPATDQNLGNVIGLNPFHDFRAWRVIKAAINIVGNRSGRLSYEVELNAAIAQLRAEHSAWVALGKPSP